MRSRTVYSKDIAPQAVGEGVSRKVLAHLSELMVVEVSFEKGAEGSPHAHPHAQCTYVKSGEFEFCVEGESVTVREGDTLAFAPDERHGCVCLSAGVLVDVFTPMREDFI